MKNKETKIEIPFGANDSELCECEYTIPSGCEAKIKDGKIIIRKVESDDEKIRKVLIDYFLRYKEQEDCGITTFYGIPTDKILAYLEKKGEHSNAAWSDEDLKRLNQVIYVCHSLGYTDVENWLKSRYRQKFSNVERTVKNWKPSKEMLKALYRVLPQDVKVKSEDEILLDKLYQELKSL